MKFVGGVKNMFSGSIRLLLKEHLKPPMRVDQKHNLYSINFTPEIYKKYSLEDVDKHIHENMINTSLNDGNMSIRGEIH